MVKAGKAEEILGKDIDTVVKRICNLKFVPQ